LLGLKDAMKESTSKSKNDKVVDKDTEDGAMLGSEKKGQSVKRKHMKEPNKKFQKRIKQTRE